MRDLHRGRSHDLRSLEVSPNLWSGVGLVRGGAGTALVGSHEEVAERISEYADLGIDHFILSGYPHLEEAWQFAEGVVPALARRGLVKHEPPRRRTRWEFRSRLRRRVPVPPRVTGVEPMPCVTIAVVTLRDRCRARNGLLTRSQPVWCPSARA